MNLPDTVAFLTWLSQHDQRFQVTDAEVEIWHHSLAVVPTDAVKNAALEFYRINDQGKPSPHAIRKIAIDVRDRAQAKQSALTAGPVIKSPTSFRGSDPERWDRLVVQGRDEHRAKMRAKGITPHAEKYPTCLAKSESTPNG